MSFNVKIECIYLYLYFYFECKSNLILTFQEHLKKSKRRILFKKSLETKTFIYFTFLKDILQASNLTNICE